MTPHNYVCVHPERIIAYTHVRYPPALHGREPIFGLGALEVTLKNGTDTVFKRHHRVYQRGASGDPYADILSLSNPGAHWLSAKLMRLPPFEKERAGEHRLRHQIAAQSLLQPGRGQHHILRMDQLTMEAFSADYSIPIAAQGASLAQQARLVPDRAQIIWLAWVTAALRADPDQDALIAAFRAWRLLDDLRPIQF